MSKFVQKMWEIICKKDQESSYYAVLDLLPEYTGMQALRQLFPSGEADSLNFVLFSTSGIHGSNWTIEDAERFLRGEYPDGDEEEDADGYAEVTYLIVHPRTVTLRFGNCTVKTQEDVDYLKRLRASSHEAIAKIGLDWSPATLASIKAAVL